MLAGFCAATRQLGWLFCLAAILGLLAAATPARAQGELIKIDAQGPVLVRADQVEYDERKLTYFAQGEVEVIRGGNRLLADRVMLNSQTLVAEAEGRVRLTMPGQVLTGPRMVVNMDSGVGKVYNGQIFIEASHYYVRGEEIEKTGRDTYEVRYGEFTTCDGQSPAWTLKGHDVEVNLDGYGTAKNTTFRIKDWPLFWTPYVVFPAKFKRQSGFLTPTFGTSQRDGTVFSIPYFQTLGDDQDTTVTLNYMSKRGLGMGLEYRYNLAPGSKGMFMIDYLANDGAADDLYKEGKLAAPYNSRYWFRGMADQNLFKDTMRLTLDIDWVSDQDYTREFSFGNSGFKMTDDRFNQWFGRGLEPDTSLIRKNRINLQRSWSSASFNGEFLYWDDLSGDNKTTLQELPNLSFSATRQAVGKTGLYFQMDSSYVYYYREEGSKGHISDITPSLSLPLNFNDYLYLEPSVTYAPRLYSVTLDDNEDTSHSKNGISQLWSTSVSASTYLYRVFDFGSAADPFKIKHGMRPYISYAFQPRIEEDDIADLARRGQSLTNAFSYGVENAFTYKIMGQDETTGEIVPVYKEFMRFNVSHSFDLYEYRRDSEQGRYWGNVDSRLEFEPVSYFYLEADSSWNLYKNRFESINGRLVASDKRGDSISIDYLNTYDSTHQINTKLRLALTTEWYLGYINRKDLKNEIDFEQSYELGYEGQCWGAKIMYVDNHYSEQGYWVVFSLGGFGELLGFGRLEQERTSSQ
jgi:LPS-assembly protein